MIIGWQVYAISGFVFVLLGLGFASMMSVIARLRGWVIKHAFWYSFTAFALLPVVIYYLALFVTHNVDPSVGDLVLLYPLGIMFVVGLFSPLVYLILRLRYRNLFQKPPVSSSDGTSNNPIKVQGQSKPKTDLISTNTNSHSQTESTFAPSDQIGVISYSGRIFVSYRRSDSADIAGRIYDRLIGKFGKETIFKDVDSIPLGLDFKEYLERKVGECDVLLAIIGDRWLDAQDTEGKRRLDDPGDFVHIEIQSALERNIPVIPLLVRDAHMPSEKDLPFGLQKLIYRNGTLIRSDPDFHRDMDRLIAALERYIN